MATLAATLATTSNSAGAITSLGGSRVETAIAKGMDAAQAKQAGNAYNAVLAKQLSNGLSMADATARAEKVFKAEANFPAPKSPQATAARNVAAGGDNVAKQLNTLAKAETPAGSAAFDKSLAVALAKGTSFADAVNKAQTAVRQAEMIAKADAAPQAMLANANAAPKPLVDRPPDSQAALSGMLAKGVSLDQAIKRADQIATVTANAVQAEAKSPASNIATGNLTALPARAESANFDKALAVSLAKGVPMDVAMKQAQQNGANEQRVIEAEARNPTTGLSTGKLIPAAADPAVDRAVANAISRGQSPEQALASASRLAEKLAPPKPTPASALASGQNVASQLLGNSTSRAYTVALGNALARGMPVEQAIALAKRTEQATTGRP